MASVQDGPERRSYTDPRHPVWSSMIGVTSVVAFAGGLSFLTGIAVAVTSGRADAPLVGIMGWLPLLLVLVGAYGARAALAELRGSVRWLDRRRREA